MEAELPSGRVSTMRNIEFVNGEYYHVYNRGTDKRSIVMDDYDAGRFLKSMCEFNVINPIGSIYENFFRQRQRQLEILQLGSRASKLKEKQLNEEGLVDIICFCLNPNHYHFVLRQVTNRGIEKFMHRLGTGHTKYFNNKHKRTGVLFQGKFKAIHIDSNEYLLHLSAYVNLNWRVHQLGSSASKLVRSSWGEYVGEYTKENDGPEKSGKNRKDFCEKEIILGQFRSVREYKKFALDSLSEIQERKGELKEIEFDA